MPSAKPPEAATTPAKSHAVVLVPRAWLSALTVLVVAPWLVVAGVHWWPQQAARETTDLPGASKTVAAKSGPWGSLNKTPIVISPPLELVADNWGREPLPPYQWLFPGTTPDVLARFLSSTGLAADQIARLQASARPEPRINGLVVTASSDLVRSLSPEVRAKLYLQLGKTPLNFDQSNAFRFAAASGDDWFAGSLISRATRELVEPLLYRRGQHLFFADIDLIRSLVTDPQEQRKLAKTLLRQPTYIVELRIQDAAEIPGLTEYWGAVVAGRTFDRCSNRWPESATTGRLTSCT